MDNIAIVVVGYNRVGGMMRLLHSLNRAEYGEDQVDLIISLDNSGEEAVVDAANEFSWNHGNKRVRTFPERQGLRKHILSCGDFLEQYDAIAVFEDDIVVSPAYYEYAKQTVAYYKDRDDVAGISLYNHRINVNANVPFMPEPGPYDVYYLQFAQSWGQIWMKKQWFAFKKWYEDNADKPIAGDNIPRYVAGWPKTSWLKYHIKYCIENNKYFVYPYASLCTCFSDVGEHCRQSNSIFQVPMMSQVGRQYRLTDDRNKLAVYDGFFEREGLETVLDLPKGSVCVDLYGNRSSFNGKRYLLTTVRKPFQVVKSFALTMRPHEYNVICGLAGDQIFLYDTTQEAAVPQGGLTDYRHISYYYNIVAGWKKTVGYVAERIRRKLFKR